jgi:hypothetical protein
MGAFIGEVVQVTRRRNNLDWDQRYILRDLRREWPVQRPFPLVLAWYWRYEALAVGVLGLVGWCLITLVGALPALAFAMVTGICVGLVPATRNVIVRAFWHVVTPHRVRRGLVEAGVYSRKRRLPEVLRVRSVAVGEEVTLWCFAGTSFADISKGLGVIGTACYAQEMQAIQDQPLHRVRLLVVRHPEAPLPPGDWPSTRVRPPADPEIYRPERATSDEREAGGAGRSHETISGTASETPMRRHRQEQSIAGGES